MKEDDKEEGLLKRLENNKDKNKELLNIFSKAPKSNVSNKNKKNKLIYNSHHSFVKFKNTGGHLILFIKHWKILIKNSLV